MHFCVVLLNPDVLHVQVRVVIQKAGSKSVSTARVCQSEDLVLLGSLLIGLIEFVVFHGGV